MTGCSNARVTAARNAFAPSIITRIERVVSKAALPQPDQQIGYSGGVLGVTLDQRKRVFGALDTDAQRDDADVVTEVDAINQQRHQVQITEGLSKQIGQRGLSRP
jgi:hypothetical protein